MWAVETRNVRVRTRAIETRYLRVTARVAESRNLRVQASEGCRGKSLKDEGESNGGT